MASWKRPLVIALALLGAASALRLAISAEDYGAVPAQFIRCYDGDTCTFDIPDWPPIVGRAIPVRLAGIDAPEIRGKCADEKRRAILARDALTGLLSRAQAIELRHLGRDKYFRLGAEIRADGEPAAERLLAAGLVRPYDGGKRESWCE